MAVAALNATPTAAPVRYAADWAAAQEVPKSPIAHAVRVRVRRVLQEIPRVHQRHIIRFGGLGNNKGQNRGKGMAQVHAWCTTQRQGNALREEEMKGTASYAPHCPGNCRMALLFHAMLDFMLSICVPHHPAPVSPMSQRSPPFICRPHH